MWFDVHVCLLVISIYEFCTRIRFLHVLENLRKKMLFESKVFSFVTEKNEEKTIDLQLAPKPQLVDLTLITIKCIDCNSSVSLQHRRFQDFVCFRLAVTTANYNNHHTMCARATLPADFVYYVAFSAFVCISISHSAMINRNNSYECYFTTISVMWVCERWVHDCLIVIVNRKTQRIA